MRYRHFLCALALVLPASVVSALEPSDLKPGLVTEYSPIGQDGTTVTRLEPTVALAFSKGEKPHPRMATFGKATWTGYINITRAGKYTFSANVANGTLDVKLGGRSVLVLKEKKEEVRAATGDAVQLDGGVMALEVSFLVGTDPRLELFWEGPGFIKEPLAYQFLGHLAQDRPKQFDHDGALEHGRFKFEELACVKCHKPTADDAMAKTLVDRTGPNLNEIGKRAYPGWIYAWLADPSKLRAHTTMPKVLTDDAAGAAERYAITQYLVSLSGKPLDVYRLPTVPPDNIRQSMERGRVLFHVTGCAACHSDPAPKKNNDDDEKEPLAPADYLYGRNALSGPTAKYNLGLLGSKTRPDALAAYLRDPLKTNPAGRMPHVNLNPAEATDVARYLCRTVDENVTPDKLPVPKLKPAKVLARFPTEALDKPDDRFDELPLDKQWVFVGNRAFTVRGCGNCHSADAGGKFAQPQGFASLDKVKTAGATGCLDPEPDPSVAPVYKLDPTERDALVAFVKDGLTGAGARAATYQARAAIKRFNCLNCHQRDGEGGIPVELADQMRQLEKAQNADDVRPPVLTGVGHKTRTPWLKSVLTQSGRARPWMQLRMPQYGESNVGFLPEALAALEGTVTDDKVHVADRTGAKLAAGRNIVGKGGLGCVSCHDIGGYANTGTRGPDLSTINQRVRYEWYERWLSQPLRMAPGTRMPQAFVDGKSTLKSVFDGDPHKQAEAMWAYLALGPGLPLPDGLEPPKGLVIAVKDRPELLRTFMPDAGSKAIAVGYPGYVSLAFSADQCRTAYAWGGNFLDAEPVWNDRGGRPARLLGQKFWSAPPGHPWGLTTNTKIPPDFLARTNNPAFGLALPIEPPRVYDGPMAVRFDGYSLDKDGKPTFRYRLDETGTGVELAIAETPGPLKSLLTSGLSRKFETTIPGGYQAWFLAGLTGKEPRAFDAAGKVVKIDLKADEVSAPVVGTRLVLPDGDRATLLEVAGAPEGCTWRFVPSRGNWLAILKLPEAKDEQKIAFSVNVFGLPKDDDTLLKELFTP